MSSLALFVALGGSSYAAIQLPRNSVSATQLSSNAVTSPKVRNGSLRVKDLDPGARTALTGAAGATGARGAEGPGGAAGSAGTAGSDAQLTGVTAGGALTGTYPSPSLAGNAVVSSAVAPDSLSLLTDTNASIEVSTFDLPSIAADACQFWSPNVNNVSSTPAGLAPVRIYLPDGLTLRTWQPTSNGVAMEICNGTASPIDAPSTSFSWLVIPNV